MSFFADIDSKLWVTLAVLALAAISNWLQHRGQSRQSGPDDDASKHPHAPPQRPGRPAPSRPAPVPESPLERELRRLFGEEVSPAPPPLAPAPPVRPVPAPPPKLPTAKARPETVATPPSVQPVSVSPLKEASAAFARAEQLHQSVAHRLRNVDENMRKHPRASPVRQTSESRGAIPSMAALRTDPHAARQAFVAALIFGPPKGLE